MVWKITDGRCGGKELPASQEEAKLLLFCTYTAADFSSAVCLFQHQLSPPVVWIQNFLENGLLFQSLTALCSQRPERDLLPEPGNQVRSKKSTWRRSNLSAGYFRESWTQQPACSVLLIETLAAVPLCLQSWPAPQLAEWARVGGAMEISHIWQSQQR